MGTEQGEHSFRVRCDREPREGRLVGKALQWIAPRGSVARTRWAHPVMMRLAGTFDRGNAGTVSSFAHGLCQPQQVEGFCLALLNRGRFLRPVLAEQKAVNLAPQGRPFVPREAAFEIRVRR